MPRPASVQLFACQNFVCLGGNVRKGSQRLPHSTAALGQCWPHLSVYSGSWPACPAGSPQTADRAPAGIYQGFQTMHCVGSTSGGRPVQRAQPATAPRAWLCISHCCLHNNLLKLQSIYLFKNNNTLSEFHKFNMKLIKRCK